MEGRKQVLIFLVAAFISAVCADLSAPSNSGEKYDEYAELPLPDHGTGITRRQGFVNERQLDLASILPVVISLGVGGALAFGAAVQQAAEARTNLQSQYNTLNNSVNTARTKISSLNTNIVTLNTAVNTEAAQANGACTAFKIAGETAQATDATIHTAVNSIINTFKNAPCPT